LLPNGGFEGSLEGWVTWNAGVGLAADGLGGGGAARVGLVGGASMFALISSPMPVASTVAGSYSLAGWFRSDSGGRSVCLYLREWDGGAVVRDPHECAAASGGWQQWPTVRLDAAAGHSLDVVAIVYDAQPGDSFELDGLTLTQP
jgi:hypothetical protein